MVLSQATGAGSRPRGIPTTYRRTRFRSRLEARWAAFFDLIDWSWVYEPFDADGWIPDFAIIGDAPLLIEVGPCDTPDSFVEKATKPLAAFPRREAACDGTTCGCETGVPGPEGHALPSERQTLVVGISPIVLPDISAWNGQPLAGYLTDDSWGFGPDWAAWATCTCGRIGVFSHMNSYQILPCGHHDGDHHLGPIDGRFLADQWADAGNRVQWRGR